ncbi:hypothetical protein HYU06_00095 [Candidatus Woesearchaeota archaeon]|nr:hypothetical protein [Candidatus Woesearchaeota archaeon]
MIPASAPPSEQAEQATLEVRLNVKSVQESAAERLHNIAEESDHKAMPLKKYVASDGFIYELRGEKILLYITSAAYNPILQGDLTQVLDTFVEKNALPVNSAALSSLKKVTKSDGSKSYLKKSVAVFDYDELRLIPVASSYAVLKVDPAKTAEREYGNARIDETGKPADINDSELGLLRMLFKDKLEPYMALLRNFNITSLGIFVLSKEEVQRKAAQLGTGFALAGKMNNHWRNADIAEIYCTQCYFIGDDFVKPAAARNGR